MSQEKKVDSSFLIHSAIENIFIFDNVTSVLDKAFELIQSKYLPAWGSVVAKSQSGGRGQLRRTWQSPAGNLYAALHLPNYQIFQDLRSTPFLGFLCLISLRRMGWPIFIKWPNDLVIVREHPGKIGGILLEEKGGNFVAGIGINLISAPPSELLRADASLPSSHLSIAPTNIFYNPALFWETFLMYFICFFQKFLLKPYEWKKIYNNLLLWQQEKVEIVDGNEKYYGQLLGINEDGGVKLANDNQIQVVYNGSMKYIIK